MTTATKLNPWELLSRLAKSNSSGCLELDEGEIYWKIYLQQGNLKYIHSSVQLLDQLKYHLHHLGLKKAITALKNLPPSYLKRQSSLLEKSAHHNFYQEAISWLVTEEHLDLAKGLKLIEHITRDELRSCLWLEEGTTSWQEDVEVPLWIHEQLERSLSLKVSECLDREQTRLKKWQKCSAELLSVHQRPYFASGWERKSLPSSGALNLKVLQELAQLLRGRTSIRQLSILLKKDEVKVAKILAAYIENKIIYLYKANPPLDKLPTIPRHEPIIEQSAQVVQSNNANNANNANADGLVKIWKIVCIDDSPTILSEIKRFLNQDRFEVTAIDNPVQAVSMIFRIKPDLILLDITMPRINGYKLCGLLRGSDYCNQTPIIMVTGNTGLIDKARAKLAGATDYFTKPFTQEKLVEIVEKYLEG